MNLARSLVRSQRIDRKEFARFFESDNSQANLERLTFANQDE